MNQLKEVLQAIAFLFIAMPIMFIASIMDQRAFKKELEQRENSDKDSL